MDLARALWAICLAVGATVTGIGIELYASGGGRMVAFPVAAAGILFLPLASAAISRFVQPAVEREHRNR